MGNIVKIYDWTVYVGDFDSVKRSNIKQIKALVERLKLPEEEKKRILTKIKKEQ